MAHLKRGTVCTVNFGPLDETAGTEIRKARPAVIVSNDHLNQQADTVLVMPITSGRHDYYHWITIKPPEGGVTVASRIITEQIATVDKRRLGPTLGRVNSKTLDKLDGAIRDHFGLPEGQLL